MTQNLGLRPTMSQVLHAPGGCIRIVATQYPSNGPEIYVPNLVPS